MLAKNGSYFDMELCVDGHYVVTGYTNDQFCNNALQLSDVKYEIHRYLTREQGFDAVFFLDSVDMLYCYDQRSFDILRGVESREETVTKEVSGSEIIVATGPLGHRRRQREVPQNQNQGEVQQNRQQVTEEGHARDNTSPLHMGRIAIRSGWDQVTRLLRFSDYRCALILSNVDSLIGSLDTQSMAILEELQSYHSVNHSIVVYLFRETSITNLFDSVDNSRFNGAWARLVQNVLLPRIDTRSPETNRVISLRTPKALEITNLLNMMRLRTEGGLKIAVGDIDIVALRLAASCARQKWGLGNLYTRLERCISEQPQRQLSAANWNEFTGEEHYLSPMEQLEALIGLEDVRDREGALVVKGVKTHIRELYEQQSRLASKHMDAPASYSRFAPAAKTRRAIGNTLNIRLKGNSGTGKSTIARLIGKLYYELGLLPQGQLVECSAAKLVTPNIGGTARLVRQKVQEAMGGVLFIDEVYALLTNSHGIEAINQLVNDLSTYEGQFAVVIAGYPDEMDNLMRANDGLAGRFPNEFILPNYTADEMRQIFLKMAGDDPDVTIGNDLLEALDNFCEAWVGGSTRSWGNAREAEKLLAAMKKRCSARMSIEGDDSDVLVLRPADVPENLQHCLAQRSQDLNEAFREIDKMIGLKNVKKFLRDTSRNILWGVEENAPGNYIFLGAPGTGKTTIARKMGEILGLLGVLHRKVNNVVECRAADLINGSVVLSELVEDARGGILFIDEAHQLAESEIGRAIIKELVPLIEDPQIHSDTCVICAGYSAEMKRFLDVDQGLSRRFPLHHRIRFDDYTATELIEILRSMAADRGEITDSADFEAYLRRSKAALEKYLENRPANFGNGGFIRDVYLPESIAARTERLNKAVLGTADGIIAKEQVEEVSDRVRRTLTEEDIPKSFVQFAGPVGKIRHDSNRTARDILAGLYGKEDFVEYAESLYVNDSELFFEDSLNVGIHYSVAGATGTGRHTAVRAMAAVYKELGRLDNDNVMFVGKADLEAGYVGHTAIKTQNVIEQAVGGTLAVTFPSAMLPKSGSDHSFGPEALGVIIGAMSEHFNDLCVVFLDTQEGMDEFLKAFPSARSQLCRQFVFEDLSPENMHKIFKQKTGESMAFEDDINELLPDFFLNWISDRGGLGEKVTSWGNGRELDQFINELGQNWKRFKGETKTAVENNGETEYEVTRRFIKREMFPKDKLKYLSSNRVLSENALEELDALTGLKEVKESIRVIERRLRRMSKGQVNPGLYCYIGNPGVGKTTVAKLMGGILKATGALSQGHVIIRTARQMCDNLDSFDSIIKLAKNGILFIDEAHQLAEPTNVYGHEVVKRLLTVLEDADIIKNTCIILAGYPMDMLSLLETDSGLASRFGEENSIIRFADYTSGELVEILKMMAKNAENIVQIGTPYPLRLSEEYISRAAEIFEVVSGSGNPNYGNARFVRNFLHDSVDVLLERLDRVYGIGNEAPEDVKDFLTIEDIPKKYRNLEYKRKRQVMIPKVDVLFDKEEKVDDDNYDALVDNLSQSVVLLETYSGEKKKGEGTGSIVTASGYVLTCAHVVRGCDRIRARLYTPGMIGGDYRWFECELLNSIVDDCDMAVLKLKGENFRQIPLRPEEIEIGTGEETVLIGYPLGAMLSGHRIDELKVSCFTGRIASAQTVKDIERFYVDTTGLHGNSGSPVISRKDGRMIGVFSGSVAPKKRNNLDELNYFYPIKYFWEEYVIGTAEKHD
jgi:Cdc6-like AAA superfamily ATPase